MALLHISARLLLALLPVFAFLLALILLDSFKLVKLRTVAGLIVAGGMAAVASLIVNRQLGIAFDLDIATLTRYVAPVIEEILKSAVIVYLVARHRVAFLVDAAIIGFAVARFSGFGALKTNSPAASNRATSTPKWIDGIP